MWAEWLHNPYSLRSSAQHGDKIRGGYLGPASSGAHIWAKWLHNPCHLGGLQCSTRGQIRSGYLTLAVSRAHMWMEWLHHYCHLRGP